MARGLGGLWLKTLKRIGRAQQAQSRKLVKSLLPKTPRVRATRPANPYKLATPRIRQRAAKPSARAAQPAAGLAGSWSKFWYVRPAEGPLTPARRMLYWLYLPSGARPEPRPLVVMLHGCQQSSEEFAAATRMNALAERKGFAVLYPQQSVGVDSHRCWHWYKRSTQQGQGEIALIAGMIRQVQGRHLLDTTRTYAAGLSAGAALATVLALRHPDLIAAVGMHSAPVFGAADSALSAYRVMQHGSLAADSAVQALPEHTGMPAMLIHGDSDSVVRRINMAQLAGQFEIVNAKYLSAAAVLKRDFPARAGGRSARHGYQTETRNCGSKPQIVTCRIRSLGHAWSGGDASMAFSEREGPDASLMMWMFFSRHRRSSAAGSITDRTAAATATRRPARPPGPSRP